MLCDLVSNSYGAAGEALGETMRQSGGLLTLSWLLAEQEPELLNLTLFLTANLSSDAVDEHSALTKSLLLQCGTEFRLFPLLKHPDDDVVTYALAAVQNLCHDGEWARVLIEHGSEPRLEELVEHANDVIVRYAAGTLKNISAHAKAAKASGEQDGIESQVPAIVMSDRAQRAVMEREKQTELQKFRERWALSTIQRFVRRWITVRRLAAEAAAAEKAAAEKAAAEKAAAERVAAEKAAAEKAAAEVAAEKAAAEKAAAEKAAAEQAAAEKAAADKAVAEKVTWKRKPQPPRLLRGLRVTAAFHQQMLGSTQWRLLRRGLIV